MRHFLILTSKQQKTMPDLPFSIVSFGKPFQTNEPPTEDNHTLNLQRIHLQAMFWMSNPCGWHPSAHNFAMRRQITMYHVPLHVHSHILTHRATSKSQAPHPPTGPLPTSPPWCKTAEDKTRRETAIHSADLLHPSILHFSSRIDSTTVTSVSSARSLEEGSLLFTAADFERWCQKRDFCDFKPRAGISYCKYLQGRRDAFWLITHPPLCMLQIPGV